MREIQQKCNKFTNGGYIQKLLNKTKIICLAEEKMKILIIQPKLEKANEQLENELRKQLLSILIPNGNEGVEELAVRRLLFVC